MKQSEFLAKSHPGAESLISDVEISHGGVNPRLHTPDVELHCKECKGQRFFLCNQPSPFLSDKAPVNTFLTYTCRNCRKEEKIIAVRYLYDGKVFQWRGKKLGEEPAFGAPVPARAIALIGPDRDLMLMGRRCENQGLGIGAFVYYRRVVENQKARIFEEIIRVSRYLGLGEDLIAQLEAAKLEVQFTQAVDSIKAAFPQMLLVNGFNPLLLLHSALSRGVHELTDAQCLELASSVRIVLFEFAERLAQAMKDEAELNEAVNRLASRRKG